MSSSSLTPTIFRMTGYGCVAALVAAGAEVVLGVGDSSADAPLVDAARLGAWIDPVPTDESQRVTWTDARTGERTTGSLADLAARIASLA